MNVQPIIKSIMSKPDLFLDSSALITGIISDKGAARVLLLLTEAGHISLTISEQVIAETERIIAKKQPKALPAYRTALRNTGLRILPDPTPTEVAFYKGIIQDEDDVPIVVAAMNAATDYLVTFNHRDFVDDPNVAIKSSLRIGTAGEALAWVRAQIVQSI